MEMVGRAGEKMEPQFTAQGRNKNSVLPKAKNKYWCKHLLGKNFTEYKACTVNDDQFL